MLFIEGKISEQQKSGIIVCIPKTKGHTVPTDYRPIMILNNDHKILARIIANWIRYALVDLLHPSQYCGVPGNTIDAVAAVTVAKAYAETERVTLFILSLHFK